MNRKQILDLCATSGTIAFTFASATLKEVMVRIEGEDVLAPVPQAAGYILICLSAAVSDLAEVPLVAQKELAP